MKALDKLGYLLSDYGLSIADEDFTIAKGYWAHKHQDCIRWEGGFRMSGARMDSLPIVIDSWDSIGDCAKGFWLVGGGAAYGKYQAIAKRKGMTEPEGVITPEVFKRLESK